MIKYLPFSLMLIIGSLLFFSACGRKETPVPTSHMLPFHQQNFSPEEGSREQTDYDQERDLETISWDLIATTEDGQVAAYGMNPGATYQEILLDIGGNCYNTGLQWHTDYRDASMARADYDGDGFRETAFVYPCGVTGGTGIYQDGLLIIDRDENGEIFWQDLFPLEMWVGDEMENRINDLIHWCVDESQKKVYVTDASTGEEIVGLPYDEEELENAAIREVFFTGHVEYILRDGEIYMECRSALALEHRVTPYYLSGKILLKVLYQGKGMLEIS